MGEQFKNLKEKDVTINKLNNEIISLKKDIEDGVVIIEEKVLKNIEDKEYLI